MPGSFPAEIGRGRATPGGFVGTASLEFFTLLGRQNAPKRLKCREKTAFLASELESKILTKLVDLPSRRPHGAASGVAPA